MVYDLIKSISYDQQEIINNILFLNGIHRIDCDPMFGRGNFYKKEKVLFPIHCSDIDPKFEYVKKCNAKLPISISRRPF